jgi:hypothetical protein
MRLIGLALVPTFTVFAAPLTTEAQQPGKVPRIGVLSPQKSMESASNDSWLASDESQSRWRVKASTFKSRAATSAVGERPSTRGDGALATSATGSAWERTPWHAVQGAARDAPRRTTDGQATAYAGGSAPRVLRSESQM